MKSLLLGLTVAAFAAGSASAECSFGMAKMSHAKKSETIAQSQRVTPEISKPLDYASLKDAWLVDYLKA